MVRITGFFFRAARLSRIMGESAAPGQCSTKQPSNFLGVIETAKRKNYRCLPLAHFRLLRSPGLSLALQARPRPLPGRRSTLLRTLPRHCTCRRCRIRNRLRNRTVRNCSRLNHWSVEDRMRAFSPAASAFACPYRLVHVPARLGGRLCKRGT